MKFIQMADLHIGRKLGSADLIGDQRYALERALTDIRAIRPDAVFLCGDLYDRSIPSVEAVRLTDWFLTALVDTGAKVFLIGGNHDSQERLDFMRALLISRGLYISGAYDGRMRKTTLSDAFGEVDIWMLPYLRPRETEAFFEDANFQSADDAVRRVIAREEIDFTRRNIMLAHQFVTALGENASLSDSEIHPVGGLSEVDVSAFDGFCYVALGHLHGPQRVGTDRARYAGSLLKYSFSETRHKKSFVAGEIFGDGSVQYSLIPIRAPRDMRVVTGELNTLMRPENRVSTDETDYILARLTDAVPPVSPVERLTSVYPNLIQVEFANALEREMNYDFDAETPIDDLARFEAFWLKMTGETLSADRRRTAAEALNAAKEKTV